jgi:predicted RNA binding protein YcfA (HicA-like mRNA interferase family)
MHPSGGGVIGPFSGFRYAEIARALRRLGFQFDRQAAGSHEI